MKFYRTVIGGRLIEARLSDLGSEQVLIDGRLVSNKPWAGLLHPSHHFDLTDDDGRPFHLEVRRHDVSKLKIGRYRMIVVVDGVERCRLEPVDLSKPPHVCANCGYSLRGQRAEAGEVRCPECGRHTPAPFLGLADEKDENEEKADEPDRDQSC